MKDLLFAVIFGALIAWNFILEIRLEYIEKENKIYHSITHKPKEPKLGNKL